MREVIEDIDRWRERGDPVALATVIETWGSAPRGVGAKMALTADGRISGSVSGGCVEGAVVEAGIETLQTDEPQLLSFGVADETAWEVGLACGGQIRVFVETVGDPSYPTARRWLQEEGSGAIVTVVDGSRDLLGRKLLLGDAGVAEGTLSPTLDEAAVEAARRLMQAGESERITVETESGPVGLFVDTISPPPTLIMVGGVHIAVALTAMAKAADFRTVVVDPRRAFGSDERFAHADRLLQAWPDEAFEQLRLTSSTAVAMLTHDPKIDDPALKRVLPSPAYYVGALGSTKTHEKRRARLLESGVREELVNRIHSPIGLDIAAGTPEEIAVAILAEVVAARHDAKAL